MKGKKPASQSAEKLSAGCVPRRKKRVVAADQRRDFPRYPAFLDISGAWAALRAGQGVGHEDIQP